MPDVVYVTTRPDAAMAYTPPVISPRIVYCKNWCISRSGEALLARRLLLLVFGRDAVGSELCLVDDASGHVRDVVGIAVERTDLRRIDLYPLRAVELDEHRAVRGHVVARV